MPVQSTLRIKRITDIQTIPDSDRRNLTNEDERVANQMNKATENIARCIVTNLTRSYFFQVVPPEQVEQTLATVDVDQDQFTLTTNQIKAIGQRLNAQAILVTQLSGYGKIKKKWLLLLIGSGVVEGTVQGVAAAAVTSSTWAGIGLAAEESLQEALTWGGGGILFNRIFTPVILEAELLSTSDGETIWTDTALARINRKALKQLPDAKRNKKEVRLGVTAEKAAQELVIDLNKKAFRNVWWIQGENSANQPSDRTR